MVCNFVRILSDHLGVSHYDSNSRSAIFVDFCYYNLIFSHYEEGFSDEKTSVLFAMMKRVFERATSRLSETLTDSFEVFKEMVVRHSTDGPDSRAVFSERDVKKITDFVSKGFYRHFRAYQLVFSSRQTIESVSHDIVVETPLAEPSLCDMVELFVGAPQQVYLRFPSLYVYTYLFIYLSLLLHAEPASNESMAQ